MARTPLYRKAETEMLRRIREGEWPVDHRLPNEFVLADEFGVSQGTMRRALITLEQMGHLERKPGRGTRVRKQTSGDAPARTGDFVRLLALDGSPLEPTVFRCTVLSQDAEDNHKALFGKARLTVFERMLKIGDARFALEVIALPKALVPDPDEQAPTHLPDFLKAHGLEADRIEDRLTARLCTMGESVALSINRDSALLILERTAREADGTPIAFQTLSMVEGFASYGP